MVEPAEKEKLRQTRAFIDGEIERLVSASGARKEAVRERNRDFIAENPFGSVYGVCVDMIRNNENDLEQAERMRLDALLLERLRPAPYFGRVDFRYDDEDDTERIYVGLKTLTDGKTFYVYDWRAPVSALFYMGELGRASYTAPAGEIGGEITLLRQYTFKDGELTHHWDAELHIDDEVLRGVLSGPSAQTMRPIVCTIQREQNAAIRFAQNKNLVVAGPAGCGKTSIGMHRLAWLMYRARSEGTAVATGMLTNNQAFRSYLAGVLPELGETETSAFSFAELFQRYLPAYKVETALQQAEQLLCGSAFRVKNVGALYGDGFCSFLDAKLDAVQPRFVSIVVLGRTVLTSEDILRRFRALPGTVPVHERLETVADWVEEELQNDLLIHRKEILRHLLEVTERGESYTERYRSLRSQILERSKEMVLHAVPTDPAAVLIRSFGEYDAASPLLKPLRTRIGAKALYFEDAVLMLYIAAKLGCCRPYAAFSHVLIDEAQDLCPLQHKILRCLFPRAQFTVLADPNQGLVAALNTHSAEALAEIYQAHMMRIEKSYRSTRQISEYAKRFLPPEAEDYQVFRREGSAPQTHVTSDLPGTLAAVLSDAAKRYRTVCVLTPTVALATRLQKQLSPLCPECTAVTSDAKPLTGGVLILPAALAKGLEFDCVLIPVFPEAPPDDRLMYLMATRALHELHVIQTEA